jgi:hypothetical protein
MNPFAHWPLFSSFPNMTPLLSRWIRLWTVLVLSHATLRALDFRGTVTFNGYPLRNAQACIQGVQC